MRSARKALVLILACILGPACGGSKPPPKAPLTIPVSPTGLTATKVNTARIDLAWTDASDNEAQFKIWRGPAAIGPFTLVGTVAANSTVHIDRGLLPGTTYFYQVTASNAAGDSPAAGPMSALTDPLSFSTYTDMTNGPPAGLVYHSAVLDSANQAMVVFGGADDFLTVYGDTYLLSLNDAPLLAGAWSPLPPPTGPVPPNVVAPPLLHGHSAIYDSLHQRMIVFAGMDDSFVLQNSLYILDLNSRYWTKPPLVGAPSPRCFHTAVYDSAHQQMIVFGGYNGTFDLQDAYTLNLPANGPFAWAPVLTAGPLKRSEHAAIVDPLGSRMIIFGGRDGDTTDGSGWNQDSWALELSGFVFWNPLSFSGTPSFRAGHTSVYDAANRRMVIFGGGTSGSTRFNDLWCMRLDTQPAWAVLTPSGALPLGRKGHSAVYDPVKMRMVIFGGIDGSDAAFYEVLEIPL